MRLRLLFTMAFVAGLSAFGQARTAQGCPAKPRTMAEMRDCFRPVLVFGASDEDARYKAQMRALGQAADALVERQMLLVPVLAEGPEAGIPDRAPSVTLTPSEQAALRKRFGVGTGEFRVVLLGKDGGEKFASAEPVSSENLVGMVDAMPMRREETRRKQARREELR